MELNLKQLAIGICIVWIGALTACSSSNPNPETNRPIEPTILTKLKKYETADPIKDAVVAIKRGEIYFLEIKGVTISVPEVPNYYTTYSSRYPARRIEGTRDDVSGPDEVRLQMLAYQYASKFNLTVLKHISRRTD